MPRWSIDMSDRAATTLSFTPLNLPWLTAVESVVDYLATAHNADPVVPTEASLLLVDPPRGLILSRNSIELTDSFGDETGGITMWRSLTIEINVGGYKHLANFSFREVDQTTTHLEAWFPESVWRHIFAYDRSQRAFDSVVKADTLQLFAGLGRALLADGFAYREALDNSLFGAVSVDYLREYVELGMPDDDSPPLMAGVAAHIVETGRFAAEEIGVPRYYYRHGRYCLFDLVWPDVR